LKVWPGSNQFYEIEIATDPSLLLYAEPAPGHVYYSSLTSEPGHFLTDQTFTLPAAVWDDLQNHDRAWYRIWTSSSDQGWYDVDVSIGNDNLDAVPFFDVRSQPRSSADFSAIIRHLRVSPDDFEQNLDQYVRQLAVLLTHHGIVSDPTQVHPGNLIDRIAEFQRVKNLTDDGIPGPTTLWALNRSWAAERGLAIERVDADPWTPPHLSSRDHGFSSFRLRADAADAYQIVRSEANAAGALITSAGSFRNIGATVTAGRSRTSFHYSGLALDLATTSGMRSIEHDAYLVTREGTRNWRVWARADQAERRTLDAVIHRNGSISTHQVTAEVIDLTSLMMANGFHSIGQRSCFPSNYLCAEWWHFQYEEALTPWVSQFGSELLSLSRYSADFLDDQTDIWAERKRIFRSNRSGWK
jgi:hypothetical protein